MSVQAGFGRCEVPMTLEMLPVSREHYASIHDRPSVKVMLLQGEIPFALITIGLVMGDRDAFLMEAEKLLKIPREYIVVHFQHILSTPHYEIEQSPALHEAYLTALREAARQALETLAPARFGIAAAQTGVTVNRVVQTRNGWWQGVNPDGETDGSVYLIRVDRKNGTPMGLVYTVNAAPGCLEFSTLPEGRAVSADLAGASERFLEAQLGGDAVAMYCTGATGDQWTALRARLDWLSPDGEQTVTDLGEAGFALVEILAVRLGEQILKTLSSLSTEALESFHLQSAQLRYPHQNVLDASPAKPARSCRYEITGEDVAGIKLLTLTEAAIVFGGVEMNVSSLKAIREASPFAGTWLVEFSETGGGYLPPEDFYDKVSYQSLKCHYAKGSAERMVQDIAAMLEEQHG